MSLPGLSIPRSPPDSIADDEGRDGDARDVSGQSRDSAQLCALRNPGRAGEPEAQRPLRRAVGGDANARAYGDLATPHRAAGGEPEGRTVERVRVLGALDAQRAG